MICPSNSSGYTGTITMSWSKSNFYMVISLGSYTQRWMLTGSTGFDFIMIDKTGDASDERDGMCLCVCGYWEPSLIWQLPGRDVTCSIWDFLATLSGVSIGSPNVVAADDAASSSICSWQTAGTFGSVIWYLLSLSWKQSAASPQPGHLNWLNFICFCRKQSIRHCIMLEIVPITHPDSSCSLSLPHSAFSSTSTSSCPSTPALVLARSLRSSSMGFHISSNVVSCFVVVNPAFSAFLISSCCCLSAVSASSTHFLATAVTLST